MFPYWNLFQFEIHKSSKNYAYHLIMSIIETNFWYIYTKSTCKYKLCEDIIIIILLVHFQFFSSLSLIVIAI